MFLFLPLTQVMSLISNEENFRAHVEEATELLKQTGFGTPGATELVLSIQTIILFFLNLG